MGYEKAIVRNLSRVDARKLGLALLVGCCIVILTYFVSMSETAVEELPSLSFKVSPVTPQNPAGGAQSKAEERHLKNAKDKMQNSVPSTVSHINDKEDKAEEPEKLPVNEAEKPLPPKKPDHELIQMLRPPAEAEQVCDFSNFRTEFCDLKGDVRVAGKSSGKSSSVVLVSPHHQVHEWKVIPYVRKHMGNIERVTVRTASDKSSVPSCTVRKAVPAIVFALGGFTGNYYHDFTDVLLPLFLTARQFDGEVQFLITNIQTWWLHKYGPIVERLTRHEFVDLDRSGEVHCHPHIMVGLRFHSDLTVDPARAPNGYSMTDFTAFLRSAYGLKRDRAVRLGGNPADGPRPRLLVVERNGTRRFTNVPQIIRMAEGLSFEVVRTDANFGDVAGFASVVNSCDVIMGVHGAGLTNFVFLPMNAVLIQIVPCCELEGMATHTFGLPAMQARLHYLEYNITVDESTLLDLYPRNDPVFTDPQSIHGQGWFKMGKIYLKKQNVKLDVHRFGPFLQKTLELLRQ